MQQKRNKKLIVKVLIVAAIIVILSYLFYPGIGQLNFILNGEPIAESMAHFVAIPSFLLIMIFTAVLMVLLFLGVGVFMFLFAMLVALLGIFIMAPYFWPVLVVVLLVIALMSVSNGSKD